MNKTKPKYTIAFDFDGVVHKYSKGWGDGTAYDVPMEGAFDMMCKVRSRGYNVVIFSARPAGQIEEWLLKYWPKEPPFGEPPEVMNQKPIAIAYIDDRGIRFSDWNQVWEDLRFYVFNHYAN